MPEAVEALLRKRAAQLKRRGELRGTEDAYVHGTLRKIEGRRVAK